MARLLRRLGLPMTLFLRLPPAVREDMLHAEVGDRRALTRLRRRGYRPESFDGQDELSLFSGKPLVRGAPRPTVMRATGKPKSLK